MAAEVVVVVCAAVPEVAAATVEVSINHQCKSINPTSLRTHHQDGVMIMMNNLSSNVNKTLTKKLVAMVVAVVTASVVGATVIVAVTVAVVVALEEMVQISISREMTVDLEMMIVNSFNAKEQPHQQLLLNSLRCSTSKKLEVINLVRPGSLTLSS